MSIIDQSSQLIVGKKYTIVDNGLQDRCVTNINHYIGTECEIIKITTGTKASDKYEIKVKLCDGTIVNDLLVRSLFTSNTYIIDTVNRHAVAQGDYACITKALPDFPAGTVVHVISVDKEYNINKVKLDDNIDSPIYIISRNHMVRVVRKDQENIKVIRTKPKRIPLTPIKPKVDYSLLRLLMERITEDSESILDAVEKSRHYKEMVTAVVWLNRNGNSEDQEYKEYMKTLEVLSQ